MLLFVGTYTEKLPHVAGRGAGIFTYRIDLKNGDCAQVGLMTAIRNPTYLALNATGTRLYAVQETDDDAAIYALAVDPAGELTVLNHQPALGSYPCHLILDRGERHVVNANYGGGSVGIYPLLDDGQLGEMSHGVQHEGSSVNAARQEGPHAHSVMLDHTGEHFFVADLGLDQVKVYGLDAGRLIPRDPAYATVDAGAGPRHIAVHPNNRFVYVVNEMGGTITGFAHADGILTAQQTISTLPGGPEEEPSCAAIRFAPSGNFLYASNRGHDSIAIFACDGETGRLTALGHESTQGEAPRDFALTPDGAYLLAANQDTDTVVVFRVDGESGQLHATGMIIDVPNPVALVMRPE